jgi:hypothetical protein
VTVPEATVNEDDLSKPRKDQVRLARQLGTMKAEAIPEGMGRLSHPEFRRRVFASHPRHQIGAAFGREAIGHGKRRRLLSR